MNSHVSNPLLIEPTRAFPAVVAIIGAGTIGPDIGYYLKSEIRGLKLYLVDVDQTKLDQAVQRFHDYARKGLARGKLTQAQAEVITQNLIATLDYSTIADSDWVIEAATEELSLKQRIFSELEEIVRKDTIITSNTSSLPAARIFARMKHPGRTTVTHFFAPAYRNVAVEVIEWEKGDPDILNYLRWLFCVTGRVPLVTADVVCFMLDRIFDNWCNEAGYLTQSAPAAQIDTVASEFAQVGPFFVLNMSNGNPIIVETNTLQAEVEGDHYRPAPIFRSVDRWNTVGLRDKVEVPQESATLIRDRLLGILYSQCADIVDRDIGTASDLDLGCRLALGFKKGPLTLMKEQGEKEVSRILERLSAERPGMPMPAHSLTSYGAFMKHILVDDLDGAIKLITIRRPDALNALHDGITDEIIGVITRYEHDEAVSGFIITGYGTRAFSAGADIGRFPSVLGNADAAAQFAREASRLLVHLDQMNKPVVAALNGFALGGGLELAIRCHSIVAVSNAYLQFPEITLGIVPGTGAMIVPYRRWPEAATVFHGMLQRAEKLDAHQAAELGIVDALADDNATLIALAVARVHHLAAAPDSHIADGSVNITPVQKTPGVSVTDQILSRKTLDILERAIQQGAAATTFATALEIGYRAFGQSACTAAAREGIDAFQQRRKPDFSTTG